MRRSKRKSMRMNMIHFKVLTARYFRQIVTSVPQFLSLVFQAPVMLAIVSLVYQEGAFTDPARVGTVGNTTLFVLVFMSALMGILNSYREICKERDVLGREVYGGLDVTSYVSSKLLVLATVGLVQSVMMVAGSMLFIDFGMPNPVPDTLFYLLALFLTNVSIASVGLFISALLKKSESAILPVLLVIIMQVVFSDMVITLDGAAKAINYITPTMWGCAIMGNRLGINDINMMSWTLHDSFNWNALLSILPLIAIVAVCYVLTVIRLKRQYRTKD